MNRTTGKRLGRHFNDLWPRQPDKDARAAPEWHAILIRDGPAGRPCTWDRPQAHPVARLFNGRSAAADQPDILPTLSLILSEKPPSRYRLPASRARPAR